MLNDGTPFDPFLERFTQLELDLFFEMFQNSNGVGFAFCSGFVASFAERTSLTFFDVKVKDKVTAISALLAPLYSFSCAVLTGWENHEICIFVVRKSLLLYAAVMDDGV